MFRQHLIGGMEHGFSRKASHRNHVQVDPVQVCVFDLASAFAVKQLGSPIRVEGCLFANIGGKLCSSM